MCSADNCWREKLSIAVWLRSYVFFEREEEKTGYLSVGKWVLQTYQNLFLHLEVFRASISRSEEFLSTATKCEVLFDWKLVFETLAIILDDTLECTLEVDSLLHYLQWQNKHWQTKAQSMNFDEFCFRVLEIQVRLYTSTSIVKWMTRAQWATIFGKRFLLGRKTQFAISVIRWTNKDCLNIGKVNTTRQTWHWQMFARSKQVKDYILLVFNCLEVGGH